MKQQTAANYKKDIGVDAKIAVTSSLNLDLTVNPDFSQVEVDRQVTNLDRYELFFPEKRQFFLREWRSFFKFWLSNYSSILFTSYWFKCSDQFWRKTEWKVE